VASLRETTATATDRHFGIGDLSLDPGETLLQFLEASLLFEPLGSCRVAPKLVLSLSDRYREPLTNALDPASEAPSFGEQVAEATLPGILRGAGDRTCPTGGGLRRCRTLSLATRVRARFGGELSFCITKRRSLPASEPRWDPSACNASASF
jgi:hypothetical protein